MRGSECPLDDELLAFHTGALPEGRSDAVTAHLENCVRCAVALERLDDMTTDPLLAALRQLILARPPQEAPTELRLPRVNGQLPPAPGLQPSPDKDWPNPPGYDILDVLGQGAMGVVYKARHLRLNRLVALKRMRLENGEGLARFQREASAVARLQHPNVVQIHEIGEHGGRPFLAFEFIDGGTLEQRMAGKPQPVSAAAGVVETLARAVHYAHAQGIVHRDLKPENVLIQLNEASDLPFGTPKITDFGIAKQLSAAAGETQEGDVIGTPCYMAPEQAGGKPGEIGPAADIYSLGVVLYELLTGRVPFQGPNTLETLLLVRAQDPVPPRALRPQVPLDLETICLKCLQKEPHKRYGSAFALAEDLRRFLADEPIQARPVGAFERCQKWARRRPTAAALAAVVIGFALLGFPLVTTLWLKAKERALAAEARRQEAEKRFYFLRIMLAEREYADGNVFQAGELLRDCPRDLRDFEWHYLSRLCQAEFIPLHGSPRKSDSAVLSPDGRHLAAVSKGHPIRIWDATTGKEMAPFPARAGDINGITFSHDGRRIASAGADGTVRVWDVRTRQEVLTAARDGAEVTCVAFSRDDQSLAAGGQDGIVRVRDAGSGREIHKLQGHTAAVCAVTFSDDGSQIATAGKDRTVRVWRARGSRSRHSRDTPTSLATSPSTPTGRVSSRRAGTGP